MFPTLFALDRPFVDCWALSMRINQLLSGKAGLYCCHKPCRYKQSNIFKHIAMRIVDSMSQDMNWHAQDLLQLIMG